MIEQQTSPVSCEGCHFEVATNKMTKGLKTEAVKTSSETISSFYDVIVVGAGFTGLVAARDLSMKGANVLLLEARDRIGGRTWTSDVGGNKYDMGGTWIHWYQPHVWAEVTRYGLTNEVKASSGISDDAICSYTDAQTNEPMKSSLEDADSRLLPLLTKFMDVDGHGGRTLFPRPYVPLSTEHIWSKWDISLQERVNQLDICKEDKEFLLPWLGINVLASPNKTSFLNFARLYALSDFQYNTFMEMSGRFKFKEGTTQLALAIFNEFQGDSLFGNPIKSIHDLGSGRVEVTTRANEVFSAASVISTIPLHCLQDIDFTPPLVNAFANTRHPNLGGKVHVHSSNTVQPWFGISDKYDAVCAGLTESESTANGTNLVTFAYTDSPAFVNIEKSPSDYISSFLKEVVPKEIHIKSTYSLWHDWSVDEFSKGNWASYGPRQLSGRHGLGEIMRNTRPTSCITLASADWANGWVGYIDGAIEQGRSAAFEVMRKLKEQKPFVKL